jgi:hypothetical protein
VICVGGGRDRARCVGLRGERHGVGGAGSGCLITRGMEKKSGTVEAVCGDFRGEPMSVMVREVVDASV